MGTELSQSMDRFSIHFCVGCPTESRVVGRGGQRQNAIAMQDSHRWDFDRCH